MKELIKKLRLAVFLLLGLIILFSLYLAFFSKPEIYGLDSLSKLPRTKEIKLSVSDNVSSIKVDILQNGKRLNLFYRELGKDKNVNFTLKPQDHGVKDGKAKIVVQLKRWNLLTSVFELDTVVDTQPPRVNIIQAPYAVYQGGAGAIRLSVSEPVEIRVRVGEQSFKAFKVNDKVFISIFPVPADTPPNTYVWVFAKDEVGNESRVGTGIRVREFKFKTYTINLDGRELKILRKIEEILGEKVSPEGFVEAFKRINEDIRYKNEKRIRELALKSEAKKLWAGKFLQLKNSKVISLFGEKRNYRYKGKFISSSRHWGYDLASVKNAPVEASNSGKVIFTGYIGIYGNVVMIDHGFGVVSLYAHLAEYRVKEGDEVKKGQIIGITDATGLAFGDHLHFGLLVQGVEVNPIEWWDAKWIERNIQAVF